MANKTLTTVGLIFILYYSLIFFVWVGGVGHWGVGGGSEKLNYFLFVHLNGKS